MRRRTYGMQGVPVCTSSRIQEDIQWLQKQSYENSTKFKMYCNIWLHTYACTCAVYLTCMYVCIYILLRTCGVCAWTGCTMCAHKYTYACMHTCSDVSTRMQLLCLCMFSLSDLRISSNTNAFRDCRAHFFRVVMFDLSKSLISAIQSLTYSFTHTHMTHTDSTSTNSTTLLGSCALSYGVITSISFIWLALFLPRSAVRCAACSYVPQCFERTPTQQYLIHVTCTKMSIMKPSGALPQSSYNCFIDSSEDPSEDFSVDLLPIATWLAM
jgi:hypothetical protein